MATIKYRDADGNLITVGAGLHTHSPSDIGAAEAEHPHDVATADNDGFLSSTDKTKIDNLNDTVFNDATGLVDLVGGRPVSEQISDHADEMASTTTAGHMSASDKTKLDGLTNYTHPANHPASMITGLANVATTGSYNDLTNKPTIPSAYTHPTTAGNKHIPSGGSSGQILRWSSSGTATWGDDNDTTYNNATQSAAGLMSATDKTKLDGIATGANKYSLPTATSSTLGGIKVGTGLSIASSKLSVSNPLPSVTTSNNGQFLRVVNGAWTAVTIKTAESEAL